MNEDIHPIGTRVEKVGGSYTFSGHVVAAFQKRISGAWRYVVEDDRGELFICRPENLSVVVVVGN